jgi:hypothetical protein
VNLGLGTAQLGMPYGIVNRGGTVPADEARKILKVACAAGVRVFDTAAQYGDAEIVLGQCLVDHPSHRVVTKLPPLPEDVADADVDAWVRREFAASLRRLRRHRLEGLLVHRVEDLLGKRGNALFDSLNGLKRGGGVRLIGASLYEGDQMEALLDRFTPDLLQVPLNLLDQRLVQGGHLRRARQRGIEIHGRSLLLQGLLAVHVGGAPSAYFEPWQSLLQEFQAAARREGLSPLQAAVGFADTVPEIDCAIIGVTSAAELKEVLAAASTRLPPDWYGRFAINDARLVNPRRWRT